jgi:Tol biopolymer transport system component
MDGGLAGDDAVTDARADGSTQLGSWGTPVPLDITPVGDDDPTATGDLLELYFNRSADIYMTKRASTSDPWDTPVAVAELDSADTETTPEVTYDGLTIYFASNRAGGLGGNDIWMSTRASRADAWGAPVLVSELSSPSAEGAATLTDPFVIYIDSDRGGSLDILVAQRSAPTDAFSSPQLVTPLNSTSDEGNPMLASDKLTIYFDSNRAGDGEIFSATRASTTAAFAPPAKVTELSTADGESDPWISPDNRTLYFTSNRDGTQRLWQTTR